MADNDLEGQNVQAEPSASKRLVSAWVPDEHVGEIDDIARQRAARGEKSSRSEVIAEAIEHYLDQQKAA